MTMVADFRPVHRDVIVPADTTCGVVIPFVTSAGAPAVLSAYDIECQVSHGNGDSDQLTVEVTDNLVRVRMTRAQTAALTQWSRYILDFQRTTPEFRRVLVTGRISND
jgi:hypothetical protein